MPSYIESTLGVLVGLIVLTGVVAGIAPLV